MSELDKWLDSRFNQDKASTTAAPLGKEPELTLSEILARSAEHPDEPAPGGDSIEAALGRVSNSRRKQGSNKKTDELGAVLGKINGSNKSPARRGRKKKRAESMPAVEETEASSASEAARGAEAASALTASTEANVARLMQTQAEEDAETPRFKKKASQKAHSTKPKQKGQPWEVHTIDAKALNLEPVPHSPDTVPGLSYDLDRCLFKPGVYPIQDQRSSVFNFDPYLATIMPLHEFDYSALKGFVSSSDDPKLIAHAAEYGKKYSGSTSSLSSMLSHFHFLLSAWRPINASHTSKGFELDSTNFTAITRAPAATYLRRRNGIYAVDADKQFDTANILSMLGRSLEKLLTLPKEEYEMYRRSKSHQLTDKQKNSDNSFHYTMLGDFIMRSQLDAHDSRLPGEGMFDIKTRAVLPVRMDAQGYEKGKDYEIRGKFGNYESFEREYFDMIRSAFLKYSLQARMGRMDGIFVAYHNTARMFGFQYFPLEELDHALHGTSSTHLGDEEFKLSLHLLNQLLDRATKKFPDQPLRLHLETRPTNPPLMYFFAKPVTEKNIEKAQNAPKTEIEKLERELMGFAEMERQAEQEKEEEGVSEEAEEGAKDVEASSLSVAEMNQKAEEAVENDELGKEYVRRSIEEALQRSGLTEGKTPEEVQADVDTLLDTLTEGADTGDVEASDVAHEERGEMDAAGNNLEQQDPADPADQPAGVDWASVADSVEQEGDAEMESDGRDAESHLDDLILSLTKQGEGEQVGDEAASDDALSKAGKFRQVLSELLTESRNEQDEAEKPSTSESQEGKEGSPTAESEPAYGEAFEDLEEDPRLLGLILTVRNKVDGEYVQRPHNLSPNRKWTVEYSIQTMKLERAHKLYAQVKMRRKRSMADDRLDRDKAWHRMFGSMLPKLSARGREFRRREEAKAMGQPVWVVGKEKEDWHDMYEKK